ncbi:protein of unknown function [Paraburkholderia dioscoreae]|uniref:Uncharacterized protein n=1 Tax=Paraburkholderia dioscoreae TaxID=2604047 RepID=A0A5Q4YSM8_9BURK|nr:protein of unknown function [Paraburkholderia dioscoreae]
MLRRHEQERAASAAESERRHRASEAGRHAQYPVEEVVRRAATGGSVSVPLGEVDTVTGLSGIALVMDSSRA